MRKQLMFFGVLLISALMLATTAYAFDANTPYTVMMNWIIPSDTTFTVALAGAETSIDFDDNVVDKDSDNVEPDSQNASTSVPIAVITNAGNQNLNFTANLTATKPSFAILIVGNTNVLSAGTIFDTTAVTIEDNVVAAGTADLYIWTNLTDADAGTTSRTFQINSVASA